MNTAIQQRIQRGGEVRGVRGCTTTGIQLLFAREKYRQSLAYLLSRSDFLLKMNEKAFGDPRPAGGAYSAPQTRDGHGLGPSMGWVGLG